MNLNSLKKPIDQSQAILYPRGFKFFIHVFIKSLSISYKICAFPNFHVIYRYVSLN